MSHPVTRRALPTPLHYPTDTSPPRDIPGDTCVIPLGHWQHLLDTRVTPKATRVLPKHLHGTLRSLLRKHRHHPPKHLEDAPRHLATLVSPHLRQLCAPQAPKSHSGMSASTPETSVFIPRTPTSPSGYLCHPQDRYATPSRSLSPPGSLCHPPRISMSPPVHLCHPLDLYDLCITLPTPVSPP